MKVDANISLKQFNTSGILGGYLLLFPTRRVHVFLFFTIISVPAILALGLWIVLQVLNGTSALGGDEAGGVAYSAHIGGFFCRVNTH